MTGAGGFLVIADRVDESRIARTGPESLRELIISLISINFNKIELSHTQ